MRSRTALALVAVALALAAGGLILFAESGGPLYAAVAGFYLPSTLPTLVLLGGVHGAPRWAWYLSYVGGPLLQNLVLLGLVFWWQSRKREAV
jgi:hypothetical protein